MKCKQCEAYKQIENHFECKANIPDEMVKTFADGTCGCKYKSKTIQELISMATDVEALDPLDYQDDMLEGQMSITDFFQDPVLEETIEIIRYNEGDIVKVIGCDEVFTVSKQSEDGRIVYVKSRLAGTQIIATSDLTLA